MIIVNVLGLVQSYIVAYAGGRSYGVQLANSVCETHVEQKITGLELHEKLGYKAYEVWEVLSGAQPLTIGSTTGWKTWGTLGYAQCAQCAEI